MPLKHGLGGRRGAVLAAAASVVLALAGGAVLAAGLSPTSGPPQPPLAGAPAATPSAPAPAGSTPSATGSPAAPAGGDSATGQFPVTLSRSAPVRLEAPSIGVHSDRLVTLGRQPDGSLQVPSDYATPGWYEPGPAPGQLGASVIAGHVDGPHGPAVFYRLGALRPGARVTVSRQDGSRAVFAVDHVDRYPKDRFPTLAVYGDATHRAELRLITCGGDFDHRTGHYLDNVVAFAHLVTA